MRKYLTAIRYWARDAVPWTTRGELRDVARHRLEVLTKLESEYAVARQGTSVAIAQRDAADERLTATQVGVRQFAERLLNSAEVTAKAATDMLQALPDHTPLRDEQREVVDGLRREESGVRSPGQDQILVITDEHRGALPMSWVAEADIVVDMRDYHRRRPRVIKNRHGAEHDNVRVANGSVPVG